MAYSEQEPLSGEESLNIIRAIIAQAKGNFRKSAYHFLLWGWVVLAGSLAHYILLVYTDLMHPQWAWAIILVGITGSAVKQIRDKNSEKVRTYTGTASGIVWITFLLNYFILLFFIQEINYQITPLVLILAAACTFISGTLIRFKPFQYGAICIWIAGIVAFLVTLPYQLLATAGAIVLGYLIPGYMLKQNNEG